ncbi:hypothetical protein P9112_002684 [Eukaryota sp. TZLM1-RC]
MPAKKKSKKSSKKKGKASKSSGPLDQFDYSNILSTVHTDTFVNHVLVTVRLSLQWSYLNFSLYLPITTPFEVIKHRLIERHRHAISNVELFLHTPDPKNKITNELSTLQDLGVEGLPYKVEPPATVDVYYDFEASSLALDQLSYDDKLYDTLGSNVLSLDRRVDAPLWNTSSRVSDQIN